LCRAKSRLLKGAWSGDLTRNSGFFLREAIPYRLVVVDLNQAHNCNIIGNKIADCGEGIWLYSVVNNSISGNIFGRKDYGLEVQTSTNTLVVGNTFQNGAEAFGSRTPITSLNNG
jgi:parallel beta-helix repeat protein